MVGNTEYGGAEYGGGTGVPSQTLGGTLAQNIKKEIVLNLQALVQAGMLNSVYEIDAIPDINQMEPTAGYPFAIVGMSSVKSDYEDQSTNKRTYRFDVLIIANYESLQDQAEGIEGLMDNILNQFDNNFTLAGAADATILPTEIERVPVTTADKGKTAFLVTIQAQKLFLITNPKP